MHSLADILMYNVVKTLPWELDAVRRQKWDAVLVNQYLCELREAKKQGRKERRHKEAQAVLAAATAAAAASSRISSFRKDVLDESSHQEVNDFLILSLRLWPFIVSFIYVVIFFSAECDEVEYF